MLLTCLAHSRDPTIINRRGNKKPNGTRIFFPSRISFYPYVPPCTGGSVLIHSLSKLRGGWGRCTADPHPCQQCWRAAHFPASSLCILCVSGFLKSELFCLTLPSSALPSIHFQWLGLDLMRSILLLPCLDRCLKAWSSPVTALYGMDL